MRQTKKIILPATSQEIEVYTYITGGEKRQINEILTSDISADVTGQAKGDISISTVYKANDKALELLVKSHSPAEINDLPSVDYDFLLGEINKITNATEYSEKKTN